MSEWQVVLTVAAWAIWWWCLRWGEYYIREAARLVEVEQFMEKSK